MRLWLRILKKYELTALVVVPLVLTVSFITSAYVMAELMKDYAWRMFTYIVFGLLFCFIMRFRKELWEDET